MDLHDDACTDIFVPKWYMPVMQEFVQEAALGKKVQVRSIEAMLLILLYTDPHVKEILLDTLHSVHKVSANAANTVLHKIMQIPAEAQ